MYVKNIKENVTEEEFRDAFGRYGPITSCCLSKWRGNSSQPNV